MKGSKIKRVVIVDTSLGGPIYGGAQTFLLNLIPGLASRNWRTSVVSGLRPLASQEQELRRAGADLVSGLWNAGALMEYIAPRLAAWVNNHNPDVYIASVSTGAAWVALPLLRPQVKTIGIAHTDSETFYEPLRHYAKLLSAAVGVSEQITRKLNNYCGITGSKAVHIPYGVRAIEPEEELRRRFKESAPRPLRLILVGRLEQPQKKILDFVVVIKQLAKLGVNFLLDIVGDGPEASEVKRLLSDETSQSRVSFYGWLPGDEVIEKLRQAEVIILTSAYEGLPVSLLEAMANGVVPVVTDLESGHRQLISHGVNGFLAPVGDTEGFVRLIEELFRDRKLLEQMRIKAWETGRQYSVENMVSSYADMFERLVDGPADAVSRPVPDYPLMPSCRSRYPLWLRRMRVVVQRSVRG